MIADATTLDLTVTDAVARTQSLTAVAVLPLKIFSAVLSAVQPKPCASS